MCYELKMTRIGIIGDFNASYHTHVAMNAAIEHAAAALGRKLSAEWIPTSALTKDDTCKLLANFHALWAAPASPYESGEGMLRGIQYARTNNVPFTGT